MTEPSLAELDERIAKMRPGKPAPAMGPGTLTEPVVVWKILFTGDDDCE